ncbi:MAG: Fibronectin type III domain protein [Methanomassiliicoccales archaeon PtaU1.Bin124]|nr:MAG: Fibronectin type III domain protein [Methanomassiliicoccales archaeon PtaU1.Bin124]
MATQSVMRSITVKAVSLFVLMVLLLPMFSVVSSAPSDGAPTAPLAPAAVAGNGKVSLTWTAPAYSNDSAITEYRVYRGVNAYDLHLLVTLGNVLAYEDVGLVNGVTYYYGIKAVNGAGDGNISAIVSATPLSVPNRPIFPVATPGNLFLNVTWSAPDFDGGSEILGYNIYRAISGGWVKIGNVSGRLWYVDSKLEIGTTYSYRITAFNQAGEGLASDSVSGTPDVVPGTVTGLQAFNGVRNITLTWNTPADNGGSPIIGYKIYRGNDSTGFTIIATIEPANTYVDRGLTDDATYYYKISAFNQVGDGVISYQVFANTYGQPHVSINAAIPGNRTVILYWYPVDDGGSSVVRYWVYRGLSNDTMALHATLNDVLTWTDEDVENGVTYYYYIVAENSVGIGASQTVAVTPMTTPGRPLELTGHSENHYVILNWNAPLDDGGSSIVAYNIYRGLTLDTMKFIGTTNSTTYIVAGLEISVEYYYKVSALNAAGEGPRSGYLKISSGKTPTQPLNVTFLEGNAFVDLSWDVPADQGTTVIQYYSIYRANGNTGSFEKIADTAMTSYNDTAVANKKSYTYYVRAFNTIGYSDQSNRIYATPHLSGTVPDAPVNVTARAGADYIYLSWDAPRDNGGQPISGYNVYRGFSNETMFYFKTTINTYLNNTNLPLNVTYYFKVCAINAIDPGEFSELVNATTAEVPVPKPVEKFLWGIFESMFFYVGLVMLGCVIGLFIYMKKFRKGGFKRKGKKKASKGAGGQLQGQNGLRKK